jgi:predicted DNA-binding transcriptional regulator AlpA
MRVMRLKETEQKVGLCDRELRHLEAQGLFPKRFQLNPVGGRAVGHLESEVDEWIQRRAELGRKTSKGYDPNRSH